MLPLIGLGLGLIGAAGKLFGRGKANIRMDQLLKSDPTYKANPLAAERLNLAKTLLNARMPGAVQAERNIYRSGANATAGATAAATDASQLLATAGEIQGNQNEAFSNLGMGEGQDYQRRYGNVSDAQQGVINEDDKVFQDQIRKFDNRFSVEGAKNQNKQAGWGDLSNLGFAGMNFGLQSGMGFGMGGGRKSTGNYNTAPIQGSRYKLPNMSPGNLPNSPSIRFN